MAGDSATGQATLGQINSLLTQIDTKSISMQNSINDTLQGLSWLIPDSWINWVKDLWNSFLDKLQQLWNLLKHIVENMGAPWTLTDTANAWSNKIGKTVSAKSQVGTAGALAVDDNWEGTAATQYREKMVLQATPLDKMRSTFSDGVNTALSSVSAGIWIFWAALVVAAAALVGGIIAALASTATVFGIPAGILIAIGAVVACAAAITAGVLIMKSTFNTANSTLRQKLSDNTGFKDGHWPPFSTQ